MDPTCYWDFPCSPSPSGYGEELYPPTPFFPLPCPQTREATTAHPHHPVTSPTMRSPLLQNSTRLRTSFLQNRTSLTKTQWFVCARSLYTGRALSTPGSNNHACGKRWTLRPLHVVCKLNSRQTFERLFHSDYFIDLTWKRYSEKHGCVFEEGCELSRLLGFDIFWIHMSSINRDHIVVSW